MSRNGTKCVVPTFYYYKNHCGLSFYAQIFGYASDYFLEIISGSGVTESKGEMFLRFLRTTAETSLLFETAHEGYKR